MQTITHYIIYSIPPSCIYVFSGNTLPQNDPPPTHRPDLDSPAGSQFRVRCRHARIGVTGNWDATGADLWLPGVQLWPLAAEGSAGATGTAPFRILSQRHMAASALHHRYAGYLHVTVPGYPDTRIPGYLVPMGTNVVHISIHRRHRETNSYVGCFLLRAPKLLILEPRLVTEIFVSGFRHFEDNDASHMVDTTKDRLIARNPFVLQGDEWRRERAIFSTLLTNGRIRTLHSIMERVCGDLCDFLAKDTTGGGPHDGTDVGRTPYVLVVLNFSLESPSSLDFDSRAKPCSTVSWESRRAASARIRFL